MVIKRLDYKTEHFEKVSVCGIRCEFSGMRIDQSTVLEGKYQYEVAGDDDSGVDPARVRLGIMVKFFGTLISDQPLPVENDGVLWLGNGDFVWLYRFVNILASVRWTRRQYHRAQVYPEW